MPTEPPVKNVMVFVDGQNLYYAAKTAFQYNHPNYDPQALARELTTARPDWVVKKIYFYTGIPSPSDNPRWNTFWVAKLAAMGSRGIVCFHRILRYRRNDVPLPDGSTITVSVGQEKGIDIRIALDVVRLAREQAYDVAVIFSQDQDLSEVADEVKAISRGQGRWIKIVCAFPVSPQSNRRGINGTEWLPIDKATYDLCLDPHDYRS